MSEINSKILYVNLTKRNKFTNYCSAYHQIVPIKISKNRNDLKNFRV